jgi:iron complex outermembrane receptor protein
MAQQATIGRRMRRWALFGTTILAAGVAASAALAADPAGAPSTATTTTTGPTLPELVVTARLVAENVQKVPVAVSVFNAQTLQTENIQTAQDLEFHTPSLNMFNNYNHTVAAISIRGQSGGTVTYFSEAPDLVLAGAPFFDTASVQVLNGPQGTLFGRTSTAGAFLVTPQHPVLSGDAVTGFVNGRVGDYGRLEITGAANLPLIPDHLALRIAARHEHVDGYTHLIGTNTNLDEDNNDQFRFSIEGHWGHFDNYAVFDYVRVDQTPASQELKAANPGVAILSLPGLVALGVPALAFAGTLQCPAAVAVGQAPDQLTCANQRLGLLAAAKSALVAEGARVAPGGNAVRSTPASYDGLDMRELLDHRDFIDIAQYDFGHVGFTDLSVKNIFSIQQTASTETQIFDGIGGRLEEASAQLSAGGGSSNQIGTHAFGTLGPRVPTYTEEFQLHGNINDGTLVWTGGVFYSDTPLTHDTTGVPNLFKVFSGVLQPNLGYSVAFPFNNGGSTTATSLYANGDLSLERWVRGLHISGGYAYAWDNSRSQGLTPIINFTTGVITPGPATVTGTSSSGDSWNFAIDEQVSPDLAFYATTRHGYRPGGTNTAAGCSQLPQCPATFGPEQVQDVELGAKWQFATGDVRGRVTADVYKMWYTNIIVGFSTTIGAQSVPYSNNAAAAELQGFELVGSLLVGKSLEFDGTFSYSHDRYTKFISSDPFNQAKPGDAICVPPLSANTCLLNLSGEEFPISPEEKGSLTTRYFLPVDESLGRISATGTLYVQSKEYLVQTPHRIAQLGGPSALAAITQPSFWRLDARIDWENIAGSRFSAALFGNNLTNKTYGLGGTFQLFTFGMFTEIYYPPRMWGGEVSYKW